MNALLLSANTLSQTFVDGQTINFGVPVRRYGRNINVSGGNVTVNGEGYYLVDASVTFEADAVGNYTVQLLENGVPITGARATVETTATTTYSVAIPSAIRIKCCEEKVITAVVTGGDGTISNATIRVVKA